MNNFIKISLLLMSMCFNLNTYSQSSRSVFVSTPGTLSQEITSAEYKSIKHIAVSGFIDKRDISHIAGIPSLETVDMSRAEIVAYTGLSSSPAHTIPNRAFSGRNIKKITLPLSCVTIGQGAFSLCGKLESVNFLALPMLASIEKEAFFLCQSLAAINFTTCPITSVGDRAFAGCVKMTSLKLGHTLTLIDNYAFSDCKSLYEVDLPGMLQYMGEGAFKGCTSLEKVSSIDEINLLDKIGNLAFNGCKKLRYIKLPKSTKYIGDHAFQNCDSLRHIVFRENIRSVGVKAFDNCTNLETIKYENSKVKGFKYIEEYAFNGCKNLKEFPYSKELVRIGRRAFNQCNALEYFTMPQSVETIGVYAFNACRSLKGDLTLPLELKKVEEGVFYYCENLTSLTIPENIKSIDRNAFNLCLGLTSITVDSDIPIDLSQSNMVFYGVPRNTCVLNIRKGDKNLYEEAPVWREFLVKK